MASRWRSLCADSLSRGSVTTSAVSASTRTHKRPGWPSQCKRERLRFGRDVVFGAGDFAAGTSRGRELMAHELTHVVQQEGGAAQSEPATIQRQPKTDTAPPVFPDFPNLALKLEDDIGQNLFDYGHHFYRLATLFPDQPELLQQAFGRYALGKNVLDTGFRFLGLDENTASRLSLGTGILFKGLNFVKDGESCSIFSSTLAVV